MNECNEAELKRLRQQQRRKPINPEQMADALYSAGYDAARGEKDYDPRGCVEWQAVVDAIARALVELDRQRSDV